MRFVVIIFLQILSFSVNSSYMFEYDKNQETFIRSTNEGENSRIRFCQTKNGDDVVFRFDCEFSNQAVEGYFQYINKTFNAFTKVTSESRLAKFYNLERSNICLLVVPESKGYNRRERIGECVKFYVPVALNFDEYSPAPHAVHVVAPGFVKVSVTLPAAQVAHAVCEFGEYLPAMHIVQVDAPGFVKVFV